MTSDKLEDREGRCSLSCGRGVDAASAGLSGRLSSAVGAGMNGSRYKLGDFLSRLWSLYCRDEYVVGELFSGHARNGLQELTSSQSFLSTFCGPFTHVSVSDRSTGVRMWAARDEALIAAV